MNDGTTTAALLLIPIIIGLYGLWNVLWLFDQLPYSHHRFPEPPTLESIGRWVRSQHG